MTLWITFATALLGIFGSVWAWYANPRRQLYAEIDAIFIKWEKLNVIRDKALASNDSDSLTVVTSQLIELRRRKSEILLRIKSSDS